MSETRVWWGALRAPFTYEDLEWRIQRAGYTRDGKQIWAKVVPYLTNRAIQNRLDEVVGPDNWQNHFTEAPGGGILCGIDIRVGEDWICKWDGAPQTDIEAVKGGLSDAMKRAAVQWGIGRHLYELDEFWAHVGDTAKRRGSFKDKKSNKMVYFKWNPPTEQEMQGGPAPKTESKQQTTEEETPAADFKAMVAAQQKAIEAQIEDILELVDPDDQNAASLIAAGKALLEDPKTADFGAAGELIKQMGDFIGMLKNTKG